VNFESVAVNDRRLPGQVVGARSASRENERRNGGKPRNHQPPLPDCIAKKTERTAVLIARNPIAKLKK
jgi:hypothetical protein